MISFLKQMIRNAGNLSLKMQPELTRSDLDFKGKKDLVTSADRAVEALIIQTIHEQFPEHGIFGEETGKTNMASEHLWIIDPIDGTTSYFHQQPFFSISIAHQFSGKTDYAAVYLPALNELFSADENCAFLNDQPIQVSLTRKLDESVMATGFACLRDGLEQNNLIYLNQILPDLRDIRRCGSAAFDLCYVACGRFDGFWEMCLNPYDIAAGAFIVEKAGGIVTDFNNSDTYPEHGIIAAPAALHEQLLPYFSNARL